MNWTEEYLVNNPTFENCMMRLKLHGQLSQVVRNFEGKQNSNKYKELVNGFYDWSKVCITKEWRI